MKIYFDGACSVNPGGISTWGAVIYTDDNKKYCIKGVVHNPEISTNNVAEYMGVIKAISFINKKNLISKGYLPTSIEVFGDSKLVIKMASKKWGWKKGKYNPHPDKPHLGKLLHKLHSKTGGMEISYKWIPRELNTEADRLSKEALDDYKKAIKKEVKKPKEIEVDIPSEIEKLLEKIPVGGLLVSKVDESGELISMYEFEYKGQYRLITFK